MQKLYCYVDESGTLPDKNDRAIVMAAVGTDLPQTLIDISRQVRKEIQSRKRGENISEIKFYRAGDKTRRTYLKKLSDCDVDIFALIVDKQGQAIPDNPENYAVLCHLLLEECLMFYKGALKGVVFDRHFHRQKDQDAFDAILSDLLNYRLSFSHVDSSENVSVNAADMVAGCLLWKYSGKSSEFYDLISDRIITETIVRWKEAKRRFIEKSK